WSIYRALGIAAALLGVLLVATGENSGSQRNEAEKPKGIAGLGWAIAAAFSFGILFWLLGIRIIPRTGALPTVWLIRVTGTVISFCLVIAENIPLRIRNKRTSAQVYGVGYMDTAAFALIIIRVRVEHD